MDKPEIVARADLAAIDVHVHLSDEVAASFNVQRRKQMAVYFGRERPIVSAESMAEFYRERRMMAVIMNSTDVTITGEPGVPNDHVAEIVSKYPDVFLGFGVVDPWEGRVAEKEIRRCKELGLVGIGELNPARQHFFPHDKRFYPLWETAAELGLIVLFHGGYAAGGSGTPGGMGVKLRYAQPIYLDDVAADFPELQIICAHPAWPWEAEAIALVLHKQNAYMDLSGWAPKYFSDQLKQYINSRIADKVLFGSDSPSMPVERWIEEFEDLKLKEEVVRKIMLENACKVFGVRPGGTSQGQRP